MTKFSFEVPLKHLYEFEDDQDFHFTLSTLYHYQEYQEYLHHVKAKGLSTLWLDNSYNEKKEADDASTLFLLNELWRPQRVVCPDSPKWTTQQIADSFEIMRKRLPVDDLLVVVRNQEMYLDLKDMGCKNFAVSYHSRREGFTQRQMYALLNLHFLGLLEPEEVRLIRPTSCDTSMPVKIAMKGWHLVDWISMGCPHIHTADLGLEGKSFFEAEMTHWQLNLAHNNIKRLKEITQ